MCAGNNIGAVGATALVEAMQSVHCSGLRDVNLDSTWYSDEWRFRGEDYPGGDYGIGASISSDFRYPNFLHGPARWIIPDHPPQLRAVARDMCWCPPDGTCMTRWFVVVLMVVAFCGPAFIPADSTSATLTLSDEEVRSASLLLCAPLTIFRLHRTPRTRAYLL